MNKKNKRSLSRREQETPIRVLTAFNYADLLQGRFNYTDAHMYNSHKAGIYFEMNHAIKPGQNVSIKVESEKTDGRASNSTYTVHYGRVKWCRPIGTKGSQRYGIGAQIFDTVLQAKIH